MSFTKRKIPWNERTENFFKTSHCIKGDRKGQKLKFNQCTKFYWLVGNLVVLKTVHRLPGGHEKKIYTNF